MEKIIKALFESSFIFNGKLYVLTCPRDLESKTNLNVRTVRTQLNKIVDESILIDTGLYLPCDVMWDQHTIICLNEFYTNLIYHKLAYTINIQCLI